MMQKFIPIIAVIYFVAFSFPSFSQLQVTPNNNATQLAQTLAGAGVIISGATLNCPSNATPANNPIGTFIGTSSNIGITGGILLTTGDILNAVGPNNQTGASAINNVTFSDPDLIKIEPQAINDVCILEFDAKPSCDTMAFTYVFGSEEYNEYVSSSPTDTTGVNDAFGIFVTGPNPSGPAYTGYNMALIPFTTTPVSIFNVNNGYNSGCPATGPCKNCNYFFDNCNGTSVQYDGFTKPITVKIPVTPCGSYHLKLAIADAVDMSWDSGVFFAMQSLACNTTLTLNTTTTASACTANNGSATVTSVIGGTAPYTYSWNTNPIQNTQTASNLSPGNYIVSVIDNNGCLNGMATVTVAITGGFTIDSSQVNVTCFGNNNGSASVNPTGGTLPYTYSWSTAPVQTSPTIVNIPAGNYSVVVKDGTGCMQTAIYTITQPPAIIGNITNTTNVSCFGGKNGSVTVSGSGGTGTLMYTWNTAPVQTTPTASNLAAGIYFVTIKDGNGCVITKTDTIKEPTGMAISISTTPTSCGTKTGTATVSSSGGATPYTYLWLTNPVQTLPTASGLASGTYTIIVSDANGCTQSQPASIGGGLAPVANFNINPDVVSLLDPSVSFTDGSSGNPSTWIWNFGDTSSANDSSILQNPFHTYSDTGIFCITLRISDTSGTCVDAVIKCLKVEAPFTFYIPNSFTPNNDGKNELFLGYGTCIKEFQLLIFDRWGNKVFESNDLYTGWNGAVNNKGNLVDEDVYVWKVKITDIYNRGHKYIGRVTLIR